MRKVMIAALVAMSLGGCQTTATGVGALAGGAGGDFLGSQFGNGMGKTLATVGGAGVGGILGGLLGNTLAMPYSNSDRIDQNTIMIDRNGRRIDRNGNLIDGMSRGGYQNGGYQNGGYQNGGYQNGQNGQNMPMTCQVVNNYVACNSGG